MSRCFKMRVTVRRYRPERMMDICGALLAQWDFDPSEFPDKGDPPPEALDVTGVDDLGGGMADDEFATRLAQAVWVANGAYCEVEVQSTDLDAAPPSTIHGWNEDEYREWLHKQAAA